MKAAVNHELERNLTLLRYLKPDVLAFTGAVFVAYQLNVIGLTLAQVMIAQSVAAATIFLCEVPSGIVSDFFNRKSIFIIAEFCYLGSILLFAFAQNFYHIILMEVLFGIAYAAISGTDSAILYETLKELGREEEYTKYQGQFVSFFLYTIAIANIISGFAGELDLRIPIIACIPISMAQLVLACFLTEPLKTQKINHPNSIIHTIGSFKWLFKYRIVFSFILLGVFVGLGRKIVLHTFNPFMELLDIPILYWGVLLAIFNLTAALVTNYSHNIKKIFGIQSILISVIMIQIIVFFLMAKVHFLMAFIWPMIHFIIWPVSTVIINSVISEKTNKERRATVLSLSSFLNQSVQIILLPVFGYIADLYSLADMFLILAILFSVTGIYIYYTIGVNHE